ncbi:TPM domain-containing protein [Paenibacillus borealis]|uniref:TPM domain-containing protein n=1 Tax=Paenibacillus borealis TaxID=160799 RepID=UPI000694E91D|nr:TPM domain-containing protein [Paenibacillus borealis]
MYGKTLKTALIAILLILLLPLAPSRTEAAVPAHSESFYVNDFAAVIDQKTENYMVNYGVKLHQQTGAQVVLVTVDSTGGTSMEDYATSLFNEWGVGSADKNNGVLLLLSTQDDDYWAVPGKGLEDTLNDNVLSRILSESLEPDFAKKDYNAGARRTYGSLIQSLGGVYSETLGTKNYVADNAGVFKQVTKDYLNQSSNRYAATTGSGIYVVTVKNSGDTSLQDYTYAKFAGVAAGPKDVMLVLDIGGDNYHVLQGKDIDNLLTNDMIGGILDTALEPKFAAKDYAGGATGTANAFYSFFLARADHSQQPAVPSMESAEVNSLPAADSPSNVPVRTYPDSNYDPLDKEPVDRLDGSAIILCFLILVWGFSVSASRRNRNIARYGIGINPHHPGNIQRYGVWTGQPDYGIRRRSYNQRSYNQRPQPRSSSSRNESRSSFWGSNSGGRGSTSGGGSGRSSSSNHGGGGSSSGGGAGRSSSSRGETNHGSGGSSSGGGSGRHSSGSSSSSGAGRHSSGSSGGGNSGGGGNASGCGGVGRHR